MTSTSVEIQFFDKSDLSADLFRKRHGHKYDYGHLLVLSGGAGQSGAARLAARGGLRIGAGLVTVGAPPDALAEIAGNITAIMMRPVANASALATLLRDTRISAVAAGPGFGLQDTQCEMLKSVLAARRKTVLDADALTLIAQNPELFSMLHPDCVLTPHEGEFARLFPDLEPPAPRDSHEDRVKIRATSLTKAAERAGCCVLRKGADTLIAAPGKVTALHRAQGESAAPWLATAGSGDVLTGFVGGLLARGADVFDAAAQAVWLHAECARSFGPGLIAEDLPEEVPKVLKGLFF